MRIASVQKHIDKYALNTHNKNETCKYIYIEERKYMKRRDLIRLLERKGWVLKRNGSNHDLYTDGKRCEAIPRHSEINEKLAQAIIRRLGL